MAHERDRMCSQSVFVVSAVDLSRQEAQRTHLLEKWSRLADSGHRVELWAMRRDEAESVWGSMKIRCPRYLPIAGIAGLSYSLSLLLSVLWWMAWRRPHVVYVRVGVSLLLVPAILPRFWGARLVVELPGPIDEEAVMYGVSPRKVRTIKRLLSRVLRRADVVVAVTEGNRAYFMRAYSIPQSKVAVIHNGANETLFRPLGTGEARMRIGLPLNGATVGFVGNLHTWQGLEVLIRAIPEIVREHPGLQVLIVGEGNTVNGLRALANGLGVSAAVHFTGQVSYREVPNYIAACDVMVAPLLPKPNGDSGYSPLKIYEYMACARPVVSSRLAGLDVVEEAGAGVLVPAGDEHALGTVVTELLGNRMKREEMGRRGREEVARNWSWDVAARNTAELLASSRDRCKG